jgi:hypothetical protein
MTTVKFENNALYRYDELGLLHSESGPTIVFETGHFLYYYHGLQTDETGLIYLKQFDSVHVWSNDDGKLTRNDGPALITDVCAYWATDGDVWGICIGGKNYKLTKTSTQLTNDCFPGQDDLYTKDIKLSDTDKTATKKVSKDEVNYYDQFGSSHNLVGPCIIRRDGSREWYRHGLWIKSMSANGVVDEPICISGYCSKDGTTRYYNKYGLLNDPDDKTPAVDFGDCTYQWFENGVMWKETLDGNVYLVFEDGRYEEFKPMIHFDRFKTQYPWADIGEIELDHLIRNNMTLWFPKSLLDRIRNEFLTTDDEYGVWKKNNDLLIKEFDGNDMELKTFAESLGFKRVWSFINHWINEIYSYQEQVAQLYVTYLENLICSGLDSFETEHDYYISELLIKRMIKNKREWRLIIDTCITMEVGFGALVKLYNIVAGNFDMKRSKLYYIIADELEDDIAYSIDSKLRDLMLIS